MSVAGAALRLGAAARVRRPLLHCGAQSQSRAHDLGIELGNRPARGAREAAPSRGCDASQLHRPSPAVLPSSPPGHSEGNSMYSLRGPGS